MGQPAELSDEDRANAYACAKSIIDGVVDDERRPVGSLVEYAAFAKLDVDVLLLQVAQFIVERAEPPK